MPGPGPGLAPETFSMSSSPPCPVTSSYMAVPYCQVSFWKPHQWSAFVLLSQGTMSFRVADVILLCLCLSQIGSFPPLLTTPFIPRGSGLYFHSRWRRLNLPTATHLKGSHGFMCYMVTANFLPYHKSIAVTSYKVTFISWFSQDEMCLMVEKRGVARDGRNPRQGEDVTLFLGWMSAWTACRVIWQG